MYENYQDPIFRKRETLLPDYVPEHLPNRTTEIETISQLIKESLEGRITHIFIHGTPGTGKTASILHIFEKLHEKTDTITSYVNCFNKNTRMAILYSIFLKFYKEKRPTRRMPSRRGIAYDELLESFLEELDKTKAKIVVCLDEVDQIKENELIYDLSRTSKKIQIISISNDEFAFKNIDPRTRSSMYPLETIQYSPYSYKQMVEIIKYKVEEAFQKDVVTKEAVEKLAEFSADHNGDVRVARETLLRAGQLANSNGDEKVDLRHIKETLEKSRHAKPMKIISELSEKEKDILNLLPEEGVFYPEFYKFYKSEKGKLGDRMFRNYLKKLSELNLIKMERKGMGGSYFISLNVPKELMKE